MPLYSAVPPPPESPSNKPAAPSQAQTAAAIDIEAWTIQALQSLSISPVARGTGTPLAIPLDGHAALTTARQVSISIRDRGTPVLRPPSARDSQRRREKLQKGQEGSRQRRRWENGTSTPQACSMWKLWRNLRMES
jgi:R3H-associated N-terminal domain